MTFQQTYKTLIESKVYSQFKKDYPNAKLVAGFFILDFLSNDTKESLDYKTDSKIFTFDIKAEEITMREDKLIEDSSKPALTEISPNIKVDLGDIPSIAQQQAEKNEIKAKFHKIISVLQMHEDNEVWNLTCMLDGLQILHILINADSGEVIKFEKKSMMDFIKRK